MPRTFGDASAVRPTGPGRFVGELDSEWTIGGKPNGGYLLAILGRAATWDATHDHVVAASAHYLSPPSPGAVVVEVEVLRTGRSASQSRVRMRQDGEACVEALVTSSHLDATGEPRWSRWLPDEAPPPMEQAVRLSPTLPDGRAVAILTQVDLRLEPETAGFTRGRPRGRAELRGWLALPDDERFDATSLLYAVDALPPATFDVEFSGWVPTLELTAYVRALPAPGPVRIVQRAQLVDAGRVDEVCLVWDRTGRLVAQATQLAGIRFT
ncbi:MAG TPA: thioesterase family protein [Acidimicrobiales bacterium]|nr:thioesterase family protein [Acidimicrobiales bacterium]